MRPGGRLLWVGSEPKSTDGSYQPEAVIHLPPGKPSAMASLVVSGIVRYLLLGSARRGRRSETSCANLRDLRRLLVHARR